jgi:hypothetical protein
MSDVTKRRPRWVRKRHVIAVVLGAATALLAATYSGAEVIAVNAANHCTHYTPPYTQDDSQGCAGLYPIYSTLFATNATALRDDNTIAASPNQNMCVDYITSGGSHYARTCATAPSVHIGFASSGYAYSGCNFSNTTSLALCMTNWHN